MESINQIAATHLGKSGGYKDSYDPKLLVPIPRSLNRTQYGIEENSLPFVGYDIWNCYEFSTLTTSGRPVNGILKITYPADSRYHVESKSLKLYLNSFNMTEVGDSYESCIAVVEGFVEADLESILQTKVTCSFFRLDLTRTVSLKFFSEYRPLETMTYLDSINFKEPFTSFDSINITKQVNSLKITSDLLRSNCRVTGQPDWGDIYIYIKTDTKLPTSGSLAKYIVSHRRVNHFHEEIAEMVYKDLFNIYSPLELLVACFYTRRGGIDINPIRASSSDLIPANIINSTLLITKTLRQ